MSPPALGEQDLISLALAEDLGTAGDVTSLAFIPEDARGRAKIVARDACRVSGIATAGEVFLRVDPRLNVIPRIPEGGRLEAGETLLEIEGAVRPILAAERTALNFLGRLCGIATHAARHADAVAGTGVKILDTRKTTPGWRVLEKRAVKAGGCENHRMGLHDAVLVKDNHLAALGDLSRLPPVIARLRSQYPGLPVEVEADTLAQLEVLLGMGGIDVILLDNMTPETLVRAVAVRDAKAPSVLLEASGGITLERLREFAHTGVERISLGGLTHSAPHADLSLEIHPVP